jgi:hypothetical protein
MTHSKFTRSAIFYLVLVGLAAIGWVVYTYVQFSSMDEGDQPMEITDKQRSLMNNKLFQFWRFIMLNLKILKAVDHSKRA